MLFLDAVDVARFVTTTQTRRLPLPSIPLKYNRFQHSTFICRSFKMLVGTKTSKTKNDLFTTALKLAKKQPIYRLRQRDRTAHDKTALRQNSKPSKQQAIK